MSVKAKHLALNGAEMRSGCIVVVFASCEQSNELFGAAVNGERACGFRPEVSFLAVDEFRTGPGPDECSVSGFVQNSCLRPVASGSSRHGSSSATQTGGQGGVRSGEPTASERTLIVFALPWCYVRENKR